MGVQLDGFYPGLQKNSQVESQIICTWQGRALDLGEILQLWKDPGSVTITALHLNPIAAICTVPELTAARTFHSEFNIPGIQMPFSRPWPAK